MFRKMSRSPACVGKDAILAAFKIDFNLDDLLKNAKTQYDAFLAQTGQKEDPYYCYHSETGSTYEIVTKYSLLTNHLAEFFLQKTRSVAWNDKVLTVNKKALDCARLSSKDAADCLFQLHELLESQRQDRPEHDVRSGIRL